jgi:hypothetical protein
VSASRETWLAVAAAALILCVNAGHVSSRMGFVHSARQVAEFDHHIYRSLALSPPGSPEEPRLRNAPFVWRVATPWIVYGLHRAGASIDGASYAVTNAALLGFLVFLFLFLRERGFDRDDALLGLALVGLMQGAVRWYEYQYWMADPLALFLIVFSFWLIEKNRLGWLVPVAVLGFAARESYVIVLPYLFLRLFRRAGPAVAVTRTAAVAALPLAVAVAIRLTITPSGDYTAWGTVQWVMEARLGKFLSSQLYVLTVGTFGVLFPLLFLFPTRAVREWRRRYEDGVVLAIVYVSLAIAISTDRILAYALPVVVPAALDQLRHFRERTGAGFAVTAAVCLALQIVFFAETQFTGRPAMSIHQPVSGWVSLSMPAAWLAAQFWIRKRSRIRTAP